MPSDVILEKVSGIEKQLNAFETDFHGFRDQVLTGQDEMLTVLKRLDEERVFTARWVERIEKNVEQHDKDLATIKAKLGIK